MNTFYITPDQLNGSNIRLVFYDGLLDEITMPTSQLFFILQHSVN